MQNWISLLPPLIVLTMAMLTHNVLRSLIVGIVAASLIAAKFSPIAALKLGFQRVLEQTGLYELFTWTGDFEKIYIYGFLISLGIIIAIITYAGGTIAYSKKVSGKLSGKKAAESLSLSLSSCFFLDDYFNSLTTGSIIRPIFDHFNIARVKLAFLIDAMTSAIAVLIPLSSWTAMIVSQLLESGVAEQSSKDTLILGDPFIIYLQAIPYCIYPLLIIATAWLIVRNRISYGSMAHHEQIALTTKNLFGGKEAPAGKLKEPEHANGTLIDFFLPMGLLVGLIVIGFLYTGNYFLLGGNNGLFEAIRASESFTTFFFSSLITLAISTLYFLLTKKITLKTMGHVYASGFELMKSSVLLVLFASTLGNLLKDDIGTGQYLASLLIGAVPVFMLPFIFFITSSAVAASTGSSWGTILVMFPIAIPMIASASITSVSSNSLLIASSVALLLPTIGAILSGSIAGAHVSPISDATVISSTAAGCHHIDHVKTQFSYVIPPIIGTSIAFILSGFFSEKGTVLSLALPLIIGLLTTTSFLYTANFLSNKKRK